MVANNLHNIDIYFVISMNSLDVTQPSTKMTKINMTIQTFVDMPIANGVYFPCALHGIQVFQIFQMLVMLLERQKLYVSSIFLNYIPLDQSIPITKVECRNVLSNFMTSIMYFLSNGNYISNWMFLQTNIAWYTNFIED